MCHYWLVIILCFPKICKSDSSFFGKEEMPLSGYWAGVLQSNLQVHCWDPGATERWQPPSWAQMPLEVSTVPSSACRFLGKTSSSTAEACRNPYKHRDNHELEVWANGKISIGLKVPLFTTGSVSRSLSASLWLRHQHVCRGFPAGLYSKHGNQVPVLFFLKFGKYLWVPCGFEWCP